MLPVGESCNSKVWITSVGELPATVTECRLQGHWKFQPRSATVHVDWKSRCLAPYFFGAYFCSFGCTGFPSNCPKSQAADIGLSPSLQLAGFVRATYFLMSDDMSSTSNITPHSLYYNYTLNTDYTNTLYTWSLGQPRLQLQAFRLFPSDSHRQSCRSGPTYNRAHLLQCCDAVRLCTA